VGCLKNPAKIKTDSFKLLTSKREVLHDKLIFAQMAKKFPTSFGNPTKLEVLWR
jgi:hypothetical protein